MFLGCVFWEIKMRKNFQNKKSIQDKLTTIKYNCSNRCHLMPDKDKCKICKEKTCVYICPADVYQLDEQTDDIIVQYENCLECGACRIACPHNAIHWTYPDSGYGVVLKNS